MAELFEAVASWHSLLFVFVVFGFAPGFLLRLLVKIYPKDDPRRQELVAELYLLGRLERMLFVGEQLETVLFEGVPARARALRQRIRRVGKRSLPPTPVAWGVLSSVVSSFLTIILFKLIGNQNVGAHVLLGPVLAPLATWLVLYYMRPRRRDARRGRDRAV